MRISVERSIVEGLIVVALAAVFVGACEQRGTVVVGRSPELADGPKEPETREAKETEAKRPAELFAEAEGLAQAGDLDRALRSLQQILNRYPADPIIARTEDKVAELLAEKLLGEARTEIEEGRPEAGAEKLRRILQVYPGAAVVETAKELLREQHQEQARTLFLGALDAYDRGEFDQAQKHFRRLCEESHNTEYGPRACAKLENFTIKVRLIIESAQVEELKQDDTPWDVAIPILSSGTLPDPWVKVYTAGKLLFETDVHPDSRFPVWNDSRAIELSPHDHLRIELWDFDGDTDDPDKIGSWGGKLKDLSDRSSILLGQSSKINLKLESH